jgi:hypothetical protein
MPGISRGLPSGVLLADFARVCLSEEAHAPSFTVEPGARYLRLRVLGRWLRVELRDFQGGRVLLLEGQFPYEVLHHLMMWFFDWLHLRRSTPESRLG